MVTANSFQRSQLACSKPVYVLGSYLVKKPSTLGSIMTLANIRVSLINEEIVLPNIASPAIYAGFQLERPLRPL